VERAQQKGVTPVFAGYVRAIPITSPVDGMMGFAIKLAQVAYTYRRCPI
jgi:hypothetical protein